MKSTSNTMRHAPARQAVGGVVERYRRSVQTQQIAQLADICAEGGKAVDTAITKCWTWPSGHDKAFAACASVPEPTELNDDVEAVASWVAAIRKPQG